jgi:O-antigen ligase
MTPNPNTRPNQNFCCRLINSPKNNYNNSFEDRTSPLRNELTYTPTHREIEQVLIAVKALLSLYMTSFYVSVAGMEMFSWVIVLLTGIHIVRHKKPFLWPPRILIVAAFSIWFIVLTSLLYNGVPQPFFQRGLLKFRWIILFIFYYNFFIYFFNEHFIKKLFVWIDALLILVAIYCCYQFVYGKDLVRPYSIIFRPLTDNSAFFRPNGFFSLTLTLTYCVSMYFCVSLARLLHMWPKPFKWHALHVAGLISSLLIIFMSFTRGAWVAFFIAVITLLALYRRQLIFYFIGIFGVIFTTLWFSFTDFKLRMLTFLDMTHLNNLERWNLWKANWLIIKENPWLGLGYLENSRHIRIYLRKIGHPNSYASHAHNNFLDYWAGNGVFGLIGFAVFIGTLLFLSISIYRKMKLTKNNELLKALLLGGIGVQLIMHIGGLTECTFKDAELNHQFMFFASLILAINYRQFERR